MQNVREGYKMTELGEIPAQWELKRLGDISEINPKKEIVEDDKEVSFIAMENVSNEGRIIQNNLRKYGEVKKGYTAFKNNDVLLAKITPCFENGKKAIATQLNNEIGFGSTEFHVLRANMNETIPSYIYYTISTNKFMQQAQANMTGSAGQKRVPTEFLKEYKIGKPQLKEQQKIALILSTVDEKIGITDNLIEKTKELKKGLMQRLLTKGIGHDRFKDTEIGRIPDEWEVKRLEEVCKKIIDGNYGAKYPKNDEFIQSGVPFLTSAVIDENNKISEKEIKFICKEKHLELKKAHTYSNDVILTNRGAKVGAVAIILEKYSEVNIGPQLTKMTCLENMLYYRYLYYVLQSELLQKKIISSNSGSAMNFMSLTIIKSILIPVATLDEQKQIASILSSVDEKIDKYKSKKEKLQELKKGLMQKLMSGKIRVKV